MVDITSGYMKCWLELFYKKWIVILWVGFILIHIAFAVAHNYSATIFSYLTKEDGLFEYLQALMYLLCSIIFLRYYIVNRKDRLFCFWSVMFSLGFLLIAGEEISWGQRIFNYHVETIEKINVQNEFNIHNIPLLSISPSRVLTLMSLSYGCLIPIFVGVFPFARNLIINYLKFPVPHPVVIVCFVSSFLWYRLYHNNSAFPLSVEESRETTVALGFFISSILMNSYRK